MNDLNSLIIDGRLTGEPVIKNINNKYLYVFSIANNYYYTVNGEQTKSVYFFDVEYWNKNNIELKKGDSIRIFGLLKQDRWEAKDGTKKNKIKILANVLIKKNFSKTNNEEINYNKKEEDNFYDDLPF